MNRVGSQPGLAFTWFSVRDDLLERVVATRIGIGRYWSGRKWIRNQVGPSITGDPSNTSRNVRRVAADIDIKRLTGSGLEDVINTPVSQDPRGRATFEPASVQPDFGSIY